MCICLLGIHIRIIASRARRGRMRSLATAYEYDRSLAKCEFASEELRYKHVDYTHCSTPHVAALALQDLKHRVLVH